MGNTLYSALSGALVKESELNIVAQNLANMNTDAYKEVKVSFESIIGDEDLDGQQRVIDQVNAGEPENLEPFVRISETNINFAPGGLTFTSNPMDLAIRGDAFFEVSTSQGNFYTRQGHFTISPDGQIMTPQGYQLLGVNGAISVNGDAPIQVKADGSVTQNEENVGQIKLVKFANNDAVKHVGGNLFTAGANAQVEETNEAKVSQGYREGSNVNMVSALSQMIEINRQFQAYHKIIKLNSELPNNDVGRVG